MYWKDKHTHSEMELAFQMSQVHHVSSPTSFCHQIEDKKCFQRCDIFLPYAIEVADMDLNAIKVDPAHITVKQEQFETIYGNHCTKLAVKFEGEEEKMSLASFECLLRDFISIPITQRKHLKRGPLRIAACPACSREYKNNPDRLLRLFNHVSAQHIRNKETLLLDIIDNYGPLIEFMRRSVANGP